MGYTAGYNFDVSNLDSNFYKKLSVGTPIDNPYASIFVGGTTAANVQIQTSLNALNDLFIDDSVRVVLKFGGISGSTLDAQATTTYHRFENPVLIDHAVADKLVIEGVAPSDHSILGVSYYDAVHHRSLTTSGAYYTGATLASADGYYAQLVVTNGNSLQMGEYLAVYDNRYQKYLNPSFYSFRDTVNGRVFNTPYPVTAEKLRASLIVGVHKIVDKIDLDSRQGLVGSDAMSNVGNKVDYVTVHIKNHNPTYTIGLMAQPITIARRGFLTPQGIIGRYEQGYGTSTVLQDPLFFGGLSSGTGSGDAVSLPGYRYASDYKFGLPYPNTGTQTPSTFFTDNGGQVVPIVLSGSSAIDRNEQGLTGFYVSAGDVFGVGDEWEQYSRLAQLSGDNVVTRNYRDTNDFRAKCFKTIIVCKTDGFVVANANKAAEIKNILLLSESGATGHGIRVENSSTVNLHQVAVVGFSNGAGVFANNKSTVNVLADKFSDPEVFREVNVFSSCNYTGFEARNHSNINAPRSIGTGNRFANYYAAENSYINAYAAISTCSVKYGIVAVGKSFVNADSSFSCFNGSDGYFASNGSLLTINAGRACYNYGNGIHAFSSGEVRAFDVIASSNRKDGIVANDMSTIVCGDSSKEPVEWDLFFGYTEPYYNFENPTNISQARFNGISGLASSTDSFINASFFETYDNSRLCGELGKLKDVACVHAPTTGYCYGGSSAGSTCDAGYRYCNDAQYKFTLESNQSNMNAFLNDLTPKDTPIASLCIPYADYNGVTAQVPVSKSRYGLVTAGLSAAYGADAGLTIGKILVCKGYFPACVTLGLGFNNTGAGQHNGVTLPPGYGVCLPIKTPDQILAGATGNASESFAIDGEVLACPSEIDLICVDPSVFSSITTPSRPISMVLPNYDVEIRDSAKIAFAGRIANFGSYDIRTGVRIQPLYRGSVLGSGLVKPATLIGYSGNKNGSELVITDQIAMETGIFGDQGSGVIDPRDYRYAVRYSSEDFLVAADLYDPVAQVGYIITTPYILNLGKLDPDTGALTSAVGATAGEIAISNTSNIPQQSMGTNDSSSSNGYPTY